MSPEVLVDLRDLLQALVELLEHGRGGLVQIQPEVGSGVPLRLVARE